jgi:hypothetical protein
MTQPQTVTIGSYSIEMRPLVDLQLMHLLRFARILQSPNVNVNQKLDTVDMMLEIIHSAIVNEADRDKLALAERNGEVSVNDYVQVLSAFKDDDAVPDKPVVRRGRPRKQQQ